MGPIHFAERAELEDARGERDFAWTGRGLWYAGTLDAISQPCVAIVGTRAATTYGKRLARSFAHDLTRAGVCVVSGLALGIDAAAHEGALDAGGCTIGVLGGGHDRFFPRRNVALAQRMIAAGGAVLSAYAPEHFAFPHQFLERNGIVAALADAVVVIEAPARSGALNTAQWAADRIPVLAVPGDVDRAHVQGCLALIRDGAILARHAADVLEVLRLPSSLATRVVPARDGLAGALLDALASGEISADTLISLCPSRGPEVLATLALLELEGLIEKRDGNKYGLL